MGTPRDGHQLFFLICPGTAPSHSLVEVSSPWRAAIPALGDWLSDHVFMSHGDRKPNPWGEFYGSAGDCSVISQFAVITVPKKQPSWPFGGRRAPSDEYKRKLTQLERSDHSPLEEVRSANNQWTVRGTVWSSEGIRPLPSTPLSLQPSESKTLQQIWRPRKKINQYFQNLCVFTSLTNNVYMGKGRQTHTFAVLTYKLQIKPKLKKKTWDWGLWGASSVGVLHWRSGGKWRHQREPM